MDKTLSLIFVSLLSLFVSTILVSAAVNPTWERMIGRPLAGNAINQYHSTAGGVSVSSTAISERSCTDNTYCPDGWLCAQNICRRVTASSCTLPGDANSNRRIDCADVECAMRASVELPTPGCSAACMRVAPIGNPDQQITVADATVINALAAQLGLNCQSPSCSSNAQCPMGSLCAQNSCRTISAAAGCNGLAGDGNSNGQLDCADFRCAQRAAVEFPTPECPRTACLNVAPIGNPDSRINVADAVVMLQLILQRGLVCSSTTQPTTPSCAEGEYRLSNPSGGRSYGAERCINGQWSMLQCEPVTMQILPSTG